MRNPTTDAASCTPLRVGACVVTFQRPAGLARLLGALESLRFDEPRPELQIFVIDNDPDESARAVVEDLRDRMTTPVVYRCEKRRGIPQARNAALAAAMGWAELIAFVDDDDVPEPDWLGELLAVQRETGADAVTGPCPSLFEAPPPAWIVSGGFFDCSHWPTGTWRHVAFTGNVLIRTAALASMSELFDEALAECGGEDSEFFQRFVWSGNKIVWCDTAVVHVHVPQERMQMRWLLARAYRTGTTESYIARKRNTRWRAACGLVLHGIYCVGKGAALLVLASIRGKAAAVQALRLVSYGAGRLAGVLGVRYAEYRPARGS